MIVIEAVYDLATPAFVGGATQREAELRVPSIKGALRFWWRATQGLHVRDVSVLREREARLFGSAAGGRSRLSICLQKPVGGPAGRIDRPRIVATGQVLGLSQAAGRGNRAAAAHGARYLGYGVMDVEGKLTRPCLQPPLSIRLRMELRPPRAAEDSDDAFDSDDAVDGITRALMALGTLGSLGSKARKGYGSLVLRALAVDGQARWRAPDTPEALRDAIAGLYAGGAPLPAVPRPEPEWTALSAHARHVLLVPATSAAGERPSGFDMLDRVGRELVRFRSFGKHGRILGGDRAERNFPDDHDLFKSGRPDRHPRRVAFGLPHNYSKSFQVRPAPGEPASRKIDRRASPLFIHIHQCGDLPVAVLSFLPARFLPHGTRLRVGPSTVAVAEPEALWSPVRAFLDRLVNPVTREAAGMARALEVVHP